MRPRTRVGSLGPGRSRRVPKRVHGELGLALDVDDGPRLGGPAEELEAEVLVVDGGWTAQ